MKRMELFRPVIGLNAIAGRTGVLIRGALALAASLIAGLHLPAEQVQAQTFKLTTSQSTVVGSGLRGPSSVVAAANGDLYVADLYLTYIVKIPAAGGPWIPIGSGFNQPRGVALDGAGNVYVMDTVNHRVMKVAVDGTQTQLCSGVRFGTDIVVDGGGNVYYLDVQQQMIFKILPSGAGPFLYWNGVPFGGLGIDRAGTLYFFNMEQRIAKLTANLVYSTLSSRIVTFTGLTADPAGNVYTFGLFGISMIPAGAPSNSLVAIPGAVSTSVAAVDPFGDLLFVRDNSSAIEKLPRSTTLGANAVCAPNSQACGKSVQLNFDLMFATWARSAVVVDEGIKDPNLDFQVAGTTCVGTLYAGTKCSVTVTFTPRFAGLRRGSVQIMDFNGIVGEAAISGIGVGPQVAFGPGVQTTVASNLAYAAGVAVDPAGNLYISEQDKGRVLKQTPTGAQTVLDDTGQRCRTLALNGRGDVFVIEYGTRVQKIDALTGARSIVLSGLSGANGIAVDGAGNLYVADGGNNRILKVPADGSAPKPVGSGFSQPRGVTVDALGNVFVGDFGNSRVVKVSPPGVQTTVYSGPILPGSVAIDAGGNLFFADVFNAQVFELPASGGSPIRIANGTGELALDAAGNLYFATGGQVVKFHRSQPPVLTYANTKVGATSTATVSVINNGNALLKFAGLTVGPSFAQAKGSGNPADCAANTSLAPGARCALSLSFAPTAVGTFQSTATLTDNSSNDNPASQAIGLKGTGVLP